MYLSFFQLERLPFRLRPDREFLCLDDPWFAGRDRLLAALQRTEPLIVLSGESGVGKTTLLESLLETLGPASVPVRVNQPQISGPEMIAAVREQLLAAVQEVGEQCPAHAEDHAKTADSDPTLTALADRLRAAHRPVLLI